MDMLAEPGKYSLEGRAIGTVYDSPANGDKPHSIHVQTGLGARSEAHLLAGGAVKLGASGPPDVGTRGESQVQEILIQRLASEGQPVSALPGATDSRGEDGLLIIDGNQYTLQVTAVPPSAEYWGTAARGSATTEVANQGAVGWLRRAVLAKSGVDDRSRTILAIDARHAGVLADPAIAEAYRQTYSSPSKEFGFAQAWVVGPTSSNCTNL